MITVFSGPCEAAGKQADAGDEEPSLGAGDGSLEVLGETALTPEPSEGAFDDPAFALRLEGTNLLGSSDDFNHPSAERGDRIAQLVAAVDAVGKDVLQLREALPQSGEQRHCAVIVLNIGSMDHDGEQKALGVGDNVAFAPSDPFGAVKPARAAAFRGFGALAVDDAGRGNNVAPHRRPRPPDQCQI